MVALITGSGGFIGRNLVNHYHTIGDWDCISVDLTTGYDLSIPGWTNNLPDRGVDVVFHLVQSLRYREFPDGTMDMFYVNVASTVELLEWARKHQVRRFIFTSTGTVYTPTQRKITETAICATSNMYAATKLSAEYLLHPYCEFFTVVIARLFGVYGPDQTNMVIASMIERVRKQQEIRLAGGVGIYLTPLFIDDCVKVLETLAQAPLQDNPITINVAGDEVLSLADIVDMIAAKLQIQPVIRRTDEKAVSLCGDNTRLRTCYRDQFVHFTEGLDLTLGITT